MPNPAFFLPDGLLDDDNEGGYGPLLGIPQPSAMAAHPQREVVNGHVNDPVALNNRLEEAEALLETNRHTMASQKEYYVQRLAAQYTAILELHQDRDYLLQLVNQADQQIQTQQAEIQYANQSINTLEQLVAMGLQVQEGLKAEVAEKKENLYKTSVNLQASEVKAAGLNAIIEYLLEVGVVQWLMDRSQAGEWGTEAWGFSSRLLRPGQQAIELQTLPLLQYKPKLQDALLPIERLGDLVVPKGNNVPTLDYYKKGIDPQHVMRGGTAVCDFNDLTLFSGSQVYEQDFMSLLQRTIMDSPEAAVNLAKVIAKLPTPPIELKATADLFLQRGMVHKATAFLMEALKYHHPEDDKLQTKLLEISVVINPYVTYPTYPAMANSTLKYYTCPCIAWACKETGLIAYTVPKYHNLPVITVDIGAQHLLRFFGSLPAEWALQCLSELLDLNLQQSSNLVLLVAKHYTEQWGAGKITHMLESHNNYHGLYHYLGASIALSQDPEEHLKYIQAAAQVNQIAEVERMTLESNIYPPERTLQFLFEAKLPDARPLINISERHDKIGELTYYFFVNNMLGELERYMQSVNPCKAAKVVGALLDADAPYDFVNRLILSVRTRIPVKQLYLQLLGYAVEATPAAPPPAPMAAPPSPAAARPPATPAMPATRPETRGNRRRRWWKPSFGGSRGTTGGIV